MLSLDGQQLCLLHAHECWNLCKVQGRTGCRAVSCLPSVVRLLICKEALYTDALIEQVSVCTYSEHGFRSTGLQQPVQGSPAQGQAARACLGTDAAGACEAAVQPQAAVVEGVCPHGHCLYRHRHQPSAKKVCTKHRHALAWTQIQKATCTAPVKGEARCKGFLRLCAL